MLTEKKNEIAGLISVYPLIYSFSAILVTLLFRKPIILWFEVILYTEEEQEAEDRRRAARNQEFDDLRELTLNDEDDEDAGGHGRNNIRVRRVVKLKTYSFKKP